MSITLPYIPGLIATTAGRFAVQVAERIAARESIRSIAPADGPGPGPSLRDLEPRQLVDRLDWLREGLAPAQ